MQGLTYRPAFSPIFAIVAVYCFAACRRNCNFFTILFVFWFFSFHFFYSIKKVSLIIKYIIIYSKQSTKPRSTRARAGLKNMLAGRKCYISYAILCITIIILCPITQLFNFFFSLILRQSTIRLANQLPFSGFAIKFLDGFHFFFLKKSVIKFKRTLLSTILHILSAIVN